jgi:hypothetical protein
LTGFVNRDEFAEVRDKVVIRLSVSTCSDQLIVPFYTKKQLKKLETVFAERPVDLNAKRMIALPEKDGGVLIEQDVQCVIMEGVSCNENRRPEEYWKRLHVVIRKRATPVNEDPKPGLDQSGTAVFNPRNNSSKFAVDKEFFSDGGQNLQ